MEGISKGEILIFEQDYKYGWGRTLNENVTKRQRGSGV